MVAQKVQENKHGKQTKGCSKLTFFSAPQYFKQPKRRNPKPQKQINCPEQQEKHQTNQ